MIKKSKTKVLIIDDNHSILEYLKTLLRRYNFDIKTSTNGFEGLQGVAEFKPDIIFLDLMMPNIDGIKMLQLKKVLNDIKDIPVIVISANAGRNNVLAAIEAGAERVLSKPINVKLLKSTVNEILGGSHFEVENTNNEISDDSLNNEIENLFFKEKFQEYRKILIEAIKNGDSNSIRNIVSLLKDYTKSASGIDNLMILQEIEKREYSKPSDWMFAEMKVKELDKNLKELVKN